MKFRCQCRPWLYYSEAIHDLYFELVSPDRTGAPPRWPRGSQIRKQFGNPSNLRNQISPWQDPWLQGGPRFWHYFVNCRLSNIIFGPNHSLFEKSFSCPHSVTWSRTLIGSRRTPTTDLVTTKITSTPLSLASSQGSNAKISDSNVDVKSTFSQQYLFREVFEALKNICCCSGCSWAYICQILILSLTVIEVWNKNHKKTNWCIYDLWYWWDWSLTFWPRLEIGDRILLGQAGK